MFGFFFNESLPSDKQFCNMEYFSMKSSLRFWELRFKKSFMTPDIVYIPIN